jgi:glycosyltransferase involved in cell wall biosynthesis
VVARAAYLAGVPAVVHLRFLPEPQMCQWLFKMPYTPTRLFFTSRTQMSDAGAAVRPVVPVDRWRLIYNGLDFEVFGRDVAARDRLRTTWGLEPGTIAIGTASSISPRKRLNQFIRLVEALIRSGVSAHGFIAGQPYFAEDESELASLRELTVALGVQGRITFLGYVEPSEPLFHAWDICVSTSEYETFGMTVLEAMACSCPVVAYPGGSIAEVVGDAAPVVKDNDFEALVETVRRLSLDPDHRELMGRRARLRAGQFDIRRSVEQLADEYRALTSGQPPRPSETG